MDNILKVYLREHPTLLLSICYFFVTIIGVLYSYYFYNEFNIAILKFADLSDFLLASILEPLSIIIFVGCLVFYYISYIFDIWCRNRFRWYGRFMENKLKAKYSDPIGFIFAIAVFTVFLIEGLAVSNADEIKSGIIDEYSGVIPISSNEQTMALLGSSSRFSYFYDVKKKVSIVLPSESISYMIKKEKIELPK